MERGASLVTDPRAWLAVALGGAAGGLARVALDAAWPAGTRVPWVTLAVNLFGAALLAVVVTWLAGTPARIPRWAGAGRRPPRLALAFVGTGFCGALTTFAAIPVEALTLARDGRTGTALAYGAATLAGGLVAVIGGTALAQRALGRRARP